MAEFKVGDRVKVIDPHPRFKTGDQVVIESIHPGQYPNTGHLSYVSLVGVVGRYNPDRFTLVEEPAQSRRMESHKEAYRAAARANDPATSKGKRKANKYEQAVLAALGEPIATGGPGLMQGVHPVGRTGKEIAEHSGHPLNCITPRFAPLRRKGLIKESGIKRDKQIVWVLA